MKRTLTESGVVFYPESHQYFLDGRELQGITGLIHERLFPDMYSGVDEEVLARAADRGTKIHEELELLDDLGLPSDYPEAKSYERIKEENGLQVERSEYIVTDRVHFASPIDKVFRLSDYAFMLADIKTTYRLNEEYVRWQLSIYAHLFEMQNPGLKATELAAIWLRGEKSKFVRVERIPGDVIADLLNAEVNGLEFANPCPQPVKEGLPQRYKAAEMAIVEIEEQMKRWKAKEEELKAGLMRAMQGNGVRSWKGECVSFSLKAASEREDFDKKRFKEENPGLYAKYAKTTKVKESLTIKLL